MFFWHIAGAILLFRWIYRDPKVDIRYLALGALLPNLIDKPLGTIIAPGLGSDRLIGHTLLFGSVIMVVALLATRRGRRRRKLMAVAIGALIHLVLDGMWASGQTFLWPFLGFDFSPGVQPYWGGFLDRELNLATIVQEVAGLAYLGALWVIAGLNDPEKRQTFIETGRLAG